MLLTALVLNLAACSKQNPPNVILVTFDTTRYDHLGCNGDPEARTPVVDGLAARGLLFDHAYASVALTLPSHTTMLSGLEPIGHGVHNNGRFRVPDDVETLAERLKAAGYDTAAFLSAFVLDVRYNLSQGFDVYSNETKPSSGPLNLGVPTRPGEEVTDEALGWLRERSGERPFFLWAHYYDAHLPRDIKDGFRDIPDPYRAEIAYADAQLGRLLEGINAAKGKRENFIIFTADHGESLGEHGESTHGLVAYDSTLHVPLILVGPGVPSGERSDAYVRHVDIVPTVLQAVGLPVPGDLHGCSLLDAARNGDGDVTGYFEARGPHVDLGWEVVEGARTRRWKYTAKPEPAELYDVLEDPDELHNVIAEHPDARAELQRRYEEIRRREHRADREGAPQEVVLTERELEQLAALGYVETPQEHSGSNAPDPRRFVNVFSWVDGARGLAMQGRFDEAIDALEALRQSQSVRSLVLRTLASIYVEAGRFDEAIGAYGEYIELTGAQEASLGIARALLRAGRPQEALARLDSLDRRGPEIDILRAHALSRLARYEEARSAVDEAFAGRPKSVERLRQRAALVIDVAPIADGEEELRDLLAQAPDDAKLQSQLGYYLAVWAHSEQGDEAFVLLKKSAEALPDDAVVQSNFGWGAYKLGRNEEAAATLQAALDLDPASQLTRFRLALALEAVGKRQRAVELLRVVVATQPGARWAENARAKLAELDGTTTGDSGSL